MMLAARQHLGPAAVCAASDFLSREQLTGVKYVESTILYLDLLVHTLPRVHRFWWSGAHFIAELESPVVCCVDRVFALSLQ